MMKIAKERVSSEFLPDIYTSVDKKYKGNYEKYAADVFKKTSLLSYDKIAEMLRNPKQYEKLRKDPAAELSLSVLVSIFQLQQLMGDAEYDIAKGERLYFAGLKEMYPEKALSSDANFTMRLSYGSIGGYRPYDAAWYNYYSTDKGILEKRTRRAMSSGYNRRYWIWFVAVISDLTRMKKGNCSCASSRTMISLVVIPVARYSIKTPV